MNPPNRHLVELHVDVIHDHSLAGPLTARGRAAPTVVTAHSPVTGEMAGYYRAVSADTSLIAISDSQRRLAPDIRWAGIVCNAVKAADFRFRTDKDDYVLFLVRMNPDKGTHLAIDAARVAGRRIVLAGKLSEPHEQVYFDAEVKPRLGPTPSSSARLTWPPSRNSTARHIAWPFPSAGMSRSAW